MNILETIKGPEVLKTMDNRTLETLAQEIRERIINVVSKNGGHLAPNLGVVELTLALHSVYSSPKDKIVWDVGHQAYVHKLLTGRNDLFDTLRQYEGLSGFPKRSESEHDFFDTGHSSTSISAALGLAQARDLKGDKHDIVAVIGDGAMTGGLAFEALNHAGDSGVNLTVILNDNEMSIAQNVGAMSLYLNRLRLDPLYTKRKEDIEYLLKKVPAIGNTMIKVADRVKDSLKFLLVPGMIFEELGFKYFGPVNGHDIGELRTVLNNTKSLNRPVIVHVITQKGKGYLPAQKKPNIFHGTGAFDIKTGKAIGKSPVPTYTKVFGDTLLKLAQEDSKIVGITAAMGEGTGLNDFAKVYPNRAFDVGIAEQHAVTMASALALEGFKPVVAIYSTFLQRAYDQAVHDVALQNSPVIFAIDRAGLVGEDGPTHHGIFDLAYLRHIPQFTIMAPKDENELQHMLFTASKYTKGPIAIRYPRGNGLGVKLDTEFKQLPIGKAEILRDGEDITLLAIGNMVDPALKVSEMLAERNISSTVINARFVKPLDQETILNSLKKTKRLVTLEEHSLAGGFGSSVLELCADNKLYPQTLRIGIKDVFPTHGNTKTLREVYELTPELIYERIINDFKLENNNLIKKIAINLIKKGS